MKKADLIQIVQSVFAAKQAEKDEIQIIKDCKPLRIKGQLFSLHFMGDHLSISPYGGGYLRRFTIEELMSDDVDIAEHPSMLGKQHAFFEVGDNMVAQGWFNPEYRWNGWAVPVFSIDECKKIIEMLHNEGGEEGYKFRRNEDDTGFYFIDFYSDPDEEYFVEDSTLTLESGQEIKVNGLIDGWCWDNIEPERYEEFNKAIADGSYQSTVSKLA
ncbi:hypothetical protein LCS82_08620 [Vibrio harveyi]|uniref:hypothetical protein n=1 Tax=Vibrio harveyi group TaxID=717610 RepID=UPI0022AA668A|nr:hypothetical protein [Vibrio alginolyticus]MCZ2798974.1 hypothetical protein [Vibrio alginolyticus]